MGGRTGRVVGAVMAAMLMVASLPSIANALIGSVSGQVIVISPPASVLLGGSSHPTSIFAFNERQGVTLASPIAVDIIAPGTYDTGSDLANNATVATGTNVDSHFLHSDMRAGGTVERVGSVTYPTQILGVIVTTARLNPSDVLGNPTTAYPTGVQSRGLELAPGGTGGDLVILPDMRTIQLDFKTTSQIDQVRVLTRHNAPPTVNAGGPYAGVEGAPVLLAGTATDSDGDVLTRSWTFTSTGDPGTTCSATNTTTVTPTLTCTDDAIVTARLTVNDGINPAVVSTASVTIGNTAPSLGALGVPGAPVPLGTPVSVTGAFTDPATNDTHTATIAWGDTTTSGGSITETSGSGTLSASHSYAFPGLYTITATLRDDDGGIAVRTAQLQVNGPPTVDAGGPYTGNEGVATGLVGTAIDPENDPLTTTWSFTQNLGGPGTSCTSTGASTLASTISCNDDAVLNAQLSASDGISPVVTSNTTITINNAPPVFGTVATTVGPIAVGAQAGVSAPFSDAGTNDTHTATVSWGDLSSSNATITETNGSGGLSAAHVYQHPGLYQVTITITDDNGGTATRTVEILVNTPPTANAGGPYVGLEGAQMALTGTASDPDGDSLTYSWTFATNADPGTVCTPTGSTTLTPTLACTDNAVVTATLSVSDGVNSPVASTTTLNVGNVAPVAGPLVPSATSVPTGGSVSVSQTFSDAGQNDTHAATIDWGDNTTSAGTLSETAGSGDVTGSHSYGAADTYTITVTITDDDDAVASRTTTVVVNASPTLAAGGPYSGSEGTAVTLAATAHDPDGDQLTKSWSITWSGDPATGCGVANPNSLTPSVTCTDDATVSATLTVSDGVNNPVTDTATIHIANVAPTVGTVTLPTSAVPVGAPVSLSASFSDPGANDTHTAVIDWGDNSSSPGLVSESGGTGSVAATHTYTSGGTFHVTVLATDDNGGHGSASTNVVVNGSPTVGVGGPYSGIEGAGVTAYATAADPDADTLSVSWTNLVTSADSGTTCSLANTSTLAPTLTCNDDASVQISVQVTDGINPPVHDTTTVTIDNAPPSVATPQLAPNPAPTGGTVSLGATFADPGTHDTHSATINWGDSTTSAGAISESGGTGTVSGTHAYAASGTYHVTLTVTDDNGGIGISSADIVVNAAPSVGAGGPYVGLEGVGVSLGATASDGDDDPLVISWTKQILSGGPGTACTLTNGSTPTPTLTCNDNATVQVTISVSDGVNPAVSDTTTVTVLNAPPSVATPLLTPSSVATGGTVALSTTFSDPGVNDTHVTTINWGDSTTSPGTISESAGSGTVTRSHVYSAPGTFTVTVTVSDLDGGIASATASVVVNAPPTASAGGPYSGVEGGSVTLNGTATDPNPDPLGTSWSIAWTGDPGTVCSLTGSTTLSPTVGCNDNAVVSATLSVGDGINPAVTSTALVQIANAAPGVVAISVPVSPVAVGTPIALQASFDDPGTNDTHTATIGWGDATSSAGTVTESNGTGSVTASHAFTAAGTYTVSVTVSDDNNGSGSATATGYLVVYDPSAGFVTGGGWITSPSGSYTPANSADTDHVGKANFGIVSKYLPNQTMPSGQTQFDLKSASLNFHSSGLAWLVVENNETKAYYMGTGTVNGAAGYDFLVSVIDGGKNTSDTFRIRVTNHATGVDAYDSQPGGADSASAATLISGGSIVIHG